MFVACKSEKENIDIPAGILSPEEMRRVLADFALAESAAVLNISNLPLNKHDSAYAFDPLTENMVRKTQFDSSLNFYAEHPDLYKQIYDSVVVTLSQMKTIKSNPQASQGLK
jgi:hypothetical protein